MKLFWILSLFISLVLSISIDKRYNIPFLLSSIEDLNVQYIWKLQTYSTGGGFVHSYIIARAIVFPSVTSDKSPTVTDDKINQAFYSMDLTFDTVDGKDVIGVNMQALTKISSSAIPVGDPIEYTGSPYNMITKFKATNAGQFADGKVYSFLGSKNPFSSGVNCRDYTKYLMNKFSS